MSNQLWTSSIWTDMKPLTLPTLDAIELPESLRPAITAAAAYSPLANRVDGRRSVAAANANDQRVGGNRSPQPSVTSSGWAPSGLALDIATRLFISDLPVIG